MKVMSYTESRAKYADVLTRVVDDCEEVVVTRSGHEPVMIVSLAEYEALKESAYLLRSTKYARVLEERIARVERGLTVEHALLEDEYCSSTGNGMRGRSTATGRLRIGEYSNASTHSSRISAEMGMRASGNRNPSCTICRATGPEGSTASTAWFTRSTMPA